MLLQRLLTVRNQLRATTITFCTRSLLTIVLAILLSLRTATASEQSLTRMVDVVEAPDTALVSMAGDPYQISQWRGRVVVVNFWATWCAPCVKELPSLQQLQDDLDAHGVKVVAINPLESADHIESYLQEWDPPPTIDFVIDETHEASLRDWRVRGFPTTYVIDQEGLVAYRAMGERDFSAEKIREQLQALINQ